eukprot:scpid42769/ scgid2281/ 
MASLYERRMKKNSALPADPPRVVLSSKPVPAKRRYVSPAPTKLHKEIVVDGFQEDMQLSYKLSGKSFYKPGYKKCCTSLRELCQPVVVRQQLAKMLKDKFTSN